MWYNLVKILGRMVFGMKLRFISFLLATVVSFSALGVGTYCSTAEAAWYYTPAVVDKVAKTTKLNKLQSKSAILIDLNNDEVLFEKKTDKKLSMASLAKLMTMLLVMEKIDAGEISMKDKVVITESAYGVEGSQVWLKPGEKFTVEELLEAVAIHSANDAAIALAEYIAGSETSFVRMMNDKVQQMGLKKTKYVDCNGLADDDKGQYTCVADIATISKEIVVNHPKLLKYTQIKRKDFRKGTSAMVTMDNTNRMLYYYKGTLGLKTGFTTRAGYNLSIVVERGNQKMLAVVMGCDDTDVRFGEVTRLLNYGFNEVERVKVASAGEVAGEVNVKNGAKQTMNVVFKEDVEISMEKNKNSEVQKEFVSATDLVAPVEQGACLGQVNIKQGNKTLKTVDVYAEGENKKANIFVCFLRWLVGLFHR